MTKRELAKYLKCHPTTVQKYAIKGLLPAYKVGNRWKFDKNEIKNWLKSKKSLNFT